MCFAPVIETDPPSRNCWSPGRFIASISIACSLQTFSRRAIASACRFPARFFRISRATCKLASPKSLTLRCERATFASTMTHSTLHASSFRLYPEPWLQRPSTKRSDVEAQFQGGQLYAALEWDNASLSHECFFTTKRISRAALRWHFLFGIRLSARAFY